MLPSVLSRRFLLAPLLALRDATDLSTKSVNLQHGICLSPKETRTHEQRSSLNNLVLYTIVTYLGLAHIRLVEKPFNANVPLAQLYYTTG